MKKLTLLLILVLAFSSPIYSQSFLSFRTNLFSFTRTYYTPDYIKAKVGFGIGHKINFANDKKFKIIMSENLDFKHTDFTYFEGGLGGGNTSEGNINFLNAQVDFRARIGKKIFGEAGFYSSYSLLKKITKGKVTTTRRCSPASPTQQPICYPTTYQEITDQNKDFSPFDFGLVVGTGFTFRDLTILLDGQLGFYKILDVRYDEFKSRQLNLSIIFPLKKLKF